MGARLPLVVSRHCSRDEECVFAIASRLLLYPDAELLGSLPDIEAAARSLPRRLGKPLLDFAARLRSAPLVEQQAVYVETFDLRRRNCLYLTYARSGDTRGRGAALLRFAELYRKRGFSLANGELVDFLPALLELAAGADPADRGPFELLVEHRPEIEILRASLETDGSPYAEIVRVVEAVLPSPDRKMVETVRRLMEEGPPDEQVGVMPDIRWLGQEEAR